MESDHYLKASLRVLVIGGQWPLELKAHRILKNIHFVYSTVVWLYFRCFVISQYIDIFQRLHEGIFSLVNNLAISLLTVMTNLKSLTIRGSIMRKLVEQIRTIEKIILDCDDEEIKRIYMYHVKWCTNMTIAFVILANATMLTFFINPLIAMYTDSAVMNGEVDRPLPLSSWFPFDPQRHYWVSYALHVVAGSMASFTIASADTFFWSMAIFAIVQLKILQYKFRNLNDHAQGFVDRGVMSKNEAFKHCAMKCILMHKMLIEYVTNLDNVMKYLMFIDFIMCSLQISTVGFQVIVVGSAFEKLFMCQFLFAALLQLFCFYWFANEILLESEKVSTAIWEGKIYEYPLSVQKNLQFVMLRAQKPLILNVGPFYHMSTSTLLLILRASYSYVTLMYQFYGDD